MGTTIQNTGKCGQTAGPIGNKFCTYNADESGNGQRLNKLAPGLDIRLVDAVARGPVDLKTYWPPKKLTGPPPKLTGPFLKTKLVR